MQQMSFLFNVTKIIGSFLPAFFVFDKMLYQISIVPQLGINHFYICVIFPQ